MIYYEDSYEKNDDKIGATETFEIDTPKKSCIAYIRFGSPSQTSSIEFKKIVPEKTDLKSFVNRKFPVKS